MITPISFQWEFVLWIKHLNNLNQCYVSNIQWKSTSQMVQYSFLFTWQNNKKGSIWKESKLTVRKYKNIDETILIAVFIYFLFLSPNGKKNYISLDQHIIIWTVYLEDIFYTGCTNPCSAPSCDFQLPISSWSGNVLSSVCKSTSLIYF